MSEVTRYGGWRTLYMTVCWVAMLVGLFRLIPSIAHQDTAAQPSVPVNYQRRFCDDVTMHDYTKSNPEVITITLKEGCFGDRVKFPQVWATFEDQKSQQPGDWAAAWCNGRPNPGPVRLSYQDMAHSLENCADLTETSTDVTLQGKGSMKFRRTSLSNRYRPSPGDEDPPDNVREIAMSPVESHDGYTFTLNECFRSGEEIHCWGKVMNVTDSPTEFRLGGGGIIDDEGNTFQFNKFQFAGVSSFFTPPERLPPGVPTKFIVTIPDNHLNVRKINFDFETVWHGVSPGRTDVLTITGVPVQ